VDAVPSSKRPQTGGRGNSQRTAAQSENPDASDVSLKTRRRALALGRGLDTGCGSILRALPFAFPFFFVPPFRALTVLIHRACAVIWRARRWFKREHQRAVDVTARQFVR
jgi:hypothetical protein